MQNSRKEIDSANTYLGLELGSTRIKAVLIDKDHNQLASGSHTWENKLVDSLWTYSQDDIWNGILECYKHLAEDVLEKYGIELESVGAIGISAMMHGYMAFDSTGKLLVPFRTWRNTNTEEAAKQLTKLLGFNIPQRWSIAHLYQAILDKDEHVPRIDYLTTLAGYIHWKLTGQRVLGIGDASGMFPIDDETQSYDSAMMKQFDELTKGKGFPWKLSGILPKILSAGENAGTLTPEGAKLLDPSGTLKAGIPMCPPEGDAGTGMVATNSVRKRSGNISAGTSVFAMAVLEKPLSNVYEEIDMVTTPSGAPVAMVHCNNFTGDVDAWVKLLGDAAKALGAQFDMDKLYITLYNKALEGDANCGGLLSYNYISGEQITGFAEGRPLFMRTPDANFSLENFMRTHLCSACASLKIGMKILDEEKVELDSMTGHGGFFKVPGVGQKIMAAAIKTPVNVMSTAAEGGPWGMAVLAAYMNNEKGEQLADYLSERVFADAEYISVQPDSADEAGFEEFMKSYEAGLSVERAAVDSIK